MSQAGVGSKSPLSEKLVAAWLKYDPFVRLIAKDSDHIRYQTMLAMVGKTAAQKFFGPAAKYFTPPKLIHAHDVRRQEQEFLDQPDSRTRIIRQLVYWGRDEFLNAENPDSHQTRIQIIHSLLGVLFLNSDPKQEKLIIDGLKVLVISRPTSIGKQGEQSLLVHQEIFTKVADILRYHHLVSQLQQGKRAEVLVRAQLIKTIQGLNDRRHRSAYYLADDRRERQKIMAQKFPLSAQTYTGLMAIIRHYSFSAWPEFGAKARKLLEELNEPFDTPEAGRVK